MKAGAVCILAFWCGVVALDCWTLRRGVGSWQFYAAVISFFLVAALFIGYNIGRVDGMKWARKLYRDEP